LPSPGEDVAKSRLSRAFAAQLGGAEVANSAAPPLRGLLVAGVVIALVAGTFVHASVRRFEPHSCGSPVAAGPRCRN
jgi:hypothetical protein